ncbi:MAG TPA: hypothetical protein VK986_19655 [Tepidisphaeraceae bacterium]|nr:hypothetical protein [Tepidisphaeraceae bacterium]
MRWILFALAGVLLICSFNGQWRVSRDSAAYRGLAHGLATQGKYVFRTNAGVEGYADQSDIRYPGLPVLLAGVEKVFGPGDAPAILLIMATGVGALLLSWGWARRSLPAWVAVVVVFGTALNGRFAEHCNEVLSDIPFLFGVMALLIAFDRLMRGGRDPVAAVVVAVCLVFLAMMRPTFWVVGLAVALTCVWGVFGRIRSCETPAESRHRRVACLISLGALVAAALVFLFVLDPRGKREGTGSYQHRIEAMFADVKTVVGRAPQNLNDLLEQTLPESFFGTQLGSGFIKAGQEVGRRGAVGKPLKWGPTGAFSLLLIGSGVALARRNVLWGMLVLTTVGTMVLFGSVPRYFLMILPVLLAGWALMVAGLARWAGSRCGPQWGPVCAAGVAFAGLGLVILPNLVQVVDLVREQHGMTRKLAYVGFETSYHGGDWTAAYGVRDMLREHVKPGERVIGPESTVLTYMSGRDVYGLGVLLPRKDTGGVWEQKLRRMSRPSEPFHFTYAIFPDTHKGLFNDKDGVTGKLIRLGMIKPKTVIARGGGYILATYEVVHVERKRGRGLRGKDLARMGLATKPSTAPAPTTKATGRRGTRGTTTAPTTTTATQPAVTQPTRVRGKPGRGLRGKDAAPATKPSVAPTTDTPK